MLKKLYFTRMFVGAMLNLYYKFLAIKLLLFLQKVLGLEIKFKCQLS